MIVVGVPAVMVLRVAGGNSVSSAPNLIEGSCPVRRSPVDCVVANHFLIVLRRCLNVWCLVWRVVCLVVVDCASVKSTPSCWLLLVVLCL